MSYLALAVLRASVSILNNILIAVVRLGLSVETVRSPYYLCSLCDCRWDAILPQGGLQNRGSPPSIVGFAPPPEIQWIAAMIKREEPRYPFEPQVPHLLWLREGALEVYEIRTEYPGAPPVHTASFSPRARIFTKMVQVLGVSGIRFCVVAWYGSREPLGTFAVPSPSSIG
ncbi:hypothetical protein BS47DRAFT_1394846 [Hydnum rufescens UP504]|uniref:Uncharacterized protein n=1 Tax=Hydnum rufescens UP504 TaxID=1448309 RepID=A0A9P6ATS2_9AGAM|nr:hypothetical protein BS47DRAFT_1394846 [Hydnum rufescens UP504]